MTSTIRNNNKSLRYILFSLLIWATLGFWSGGQTRLLNALDTASLGNQMHTIERGTRIYENFRAIREDVFQKLKGNALDSVAELKSQISTKIALQKNLEARIDSLTSALSETKQKLEEVQKTKNSLSFLGITVSKVAYNFIMWGIVGGLLFVLIMLFLVYKRDRAVTLQLKRDLNELREEFESYRKSSRERMEKLVVSHHREIQKLKGEL